jgi:hypothetical protein
MDVVLAMKGATLFSDQRDIEDYIDMVLRNAKMLSGVEYFEQKRVCDAFFG